uniref:NADH-ubiquinone oxidoreductase subunit 8 n=1 Tax=Trypanosoma brucei brucei TaxID=5702 RepID=NDUS8_TRYBB|nr:RecName: Full=NADH-ubiquinone oxidoreductase subunit 8; AltName: Full=Maxicircle iron-sulfur protein 1 [Trypanosoma brucei brucei]AAA91499.1 NADH dehydrogenase subunit 8 [Trypanosoma brucei]
MFFFDFLFFFFVCFYMCFVCCVTICLPIELTIVSLLVRGNHFLRFYWCGLERCIACRLCDLICPSLALDVRVGWSFGGHRFADWFTLSYRRCIYCGFCMHVCPTDAITHSLFVMCFCCLAMYLLAPKFLLFGCCFMLFDFYLCFV